MSADPRESSASRGDDLFDLPTEAPQAREIASLPSSAVGMDVDKPSSALPRRMPSSNPAGPPLTSVQATPTGIQEQLRGQAATTAPAAPVVVAVKTKVPKVPKITPITAMWIAFAGFALVTGWGLGSIVVEKHTASGTPDEHATPVEHAAASEHAAANDHAAASVNDTTNAPQTSPVVTPDTTHASVAIHATPPVVQHALPPPPVVTDAERLETANAALTAAREDMAAGRRGSARARLARVGLAIDAIQPSVRAAIRAEAALLLAQCIQADADEAARTP